ncbi:hypothetical protein HDV02_000543 [Globomyces sp. JEL0801]|nr:hypothetical protein HDV02_000543 [Globomyces sp. JEL0801]
MAIEASILIVYSRYKQLQLKNFKNEHAKYDSFSNLQTGVPDSEAKSMRFSGYRRDELGTFVLNSIVVTSLAWFIAMTIIICDYYEVFGRYADNNHLLFGNHDNLSLIFILVWHLSTGWFLGLHCYKGKLKTWFLAPVPISDASHILIEKKRQTPVRTEDMGDLVQWLQDVESKIRAATNTNVTKEIIELQYTQNGRGYIEFECVRYILNRKTDTFEPFVFSCGSSNSELIRQSKGLTSKEADERIEMSGNNEILFKMNSFLEGIVKEFSGIFYLYQLMTLTIWYFYAYYYMGLVLTCIIIGSGITKVIVSAKAQKRVLEMATFIGTAKVYRDSKWIEIESRNIAVGDVIEIVAEGSPLSVDCVILSGDVVVDESSLTGEALPVTKFALKEDNKPFIKESTGKLNCLFAGTTVLETQHSVDGDRIKALVLETGGSTEKGKLVRDILYPVPFVFVFTEHLKIVVPILIFWGIVMLIISVLMLGTEGYDAWFYGMFGISQVLSPLIPAVLVIGQSVSAERLRHRGIMCVDLNRITLAGKVKVFCFDKTGTLTKEGLDFMGAHEIDVSKKEFIPLKDNFFLFTPQMKLAMQTCHSISLVKGKSVGNFVDIEMFNATGANVDPNSFTSIYPHLSESVIKIWKRFEFVHAHAYMSVVAHDSESKMTSVFLKGSFEKISGLVDKDDIPSDFVEVAKQHALEGHYVLAIACKQLPQDFTAEKVEVSSRDDLERGAKIIGLLLFRNELKHDTADALTHLRNGGCRTVMITGDHANTATFIGKACGLLSNEQIILMAEYIDNEVVWHNVADKSKWTQSNVEKAVYNSRSGGRQVELVIAGQAFKTLMEHCWIPQFLGDIRIFARMSPLDKVHCVRLHMSQHITAMCGDGGNDAGALKAAHAGIALSGSGTSVVSHFSSCNLSINSCVELVREARCSLDVSIASYKVLIMYGETLAMNGLVMYYYKVQMSQAMWIFIDGCTVPLSWALTMAKPALKLIPFRPTARLIGFETVLSVLGQIFINSCFILAMVALLYNQSFYRCHEFDGSQADLRKWWELADNYEGAILGVLTMFQILHSSCVFNLGNKYRQGFWKNRIFILAYATGCALLSGLVLSDPNALTCLFHINCGTEESLINLGYVVNFITPSEYFNNIGHNVIPVQFRWVILVFAFFNLLALLFWEKVVILGPVRQFAKIIANGKWQVKKAPIKV